METFKNTEIAFKRKSTAELKRGTILFKSFNYPWLIKYGPKWASRALSIGLPIKGIIKKTLFAWFCGGESISDCSTTITNLSKNNVGTILDYSVEGDDNDNAYDITTNEIIETIHRAKGNKGIPYSVFKTTGLVKNNLLEKIGLRFELNDNEKKDYLEFKQRFGQICNSA